MAVITLMTDFGNKDGFVGTMKGVIWQICPSAQIADISHEIAPQNIREGAIALWRAAPFFPADTVHIAVVDPGVGTRRRPMAARLGNMYFVGPDNGLFTPFIENAIAKGEPRRFVTLDQPRWFLPKVSRTFHGRDIFSPVGAYLASGVPLEALGTIFDDPVLLPLSQPEPTAQGYTAHISVVDVFGNCTTDLPASAIAGHEIEIRVKGKTVRGLSSSYGHHQPGELIALVDSEDFLEVAVVNGSAANALNAQVGDEVEVIFTN